MIPRVLHLRGVTRLERQEMLARLDRAILRGGGALLDFHRYSNIAVALTFEIPVRDVRRLLAALTGTGLRLHPESLALLGACADEAEARGAGGDTREVRGALNVTFIHNEPDLRIEIPPIPG